jgi:hypothetical protein
MKRNRAAALGLAAPLLLAGCGALSDASYAVARDGAERALAATFSLSAGVVSWLEETPEPQKPPCRG